MKTLIKNGRIIDPAQGIDEELNVLLIDGKIDRITRKEPEADVIIDAAGKNVCPGFIDVHAHEDPVKDGRIYHDKEKANLACLLRMGVTTCLCGNCGDNFCEPSEFLNLFQQGGCFVNVVMLAGYTYFREKYSAADRYSHITPEEKTTVERAIKAALKNGCAGISFGLEYVPGTDRAELMTAAKACADSNACIRFYFSFNF